MTVPTRFHSTQFLLASALVLTACLVGTFWLFGTPLSTQANGDLPAGAAGTGRAKCVTSPVSLAPDATTVNEPALAAPLAGVYKLIGWNDLGMHCMNENFSNMAVLPPYNTVWAQLVLQGATPRVITTGVTIEYSLIDNSYSACQNGKCKSNFWQYAAQLFPGSPAATQPNVGLTGRTVTGTLDPKPDHFTAEGIPITPYLDSAPAFTPANWYPYQRAQLVAKDTITHKILAQTTIVTPVSTEMRCDTCHADGKDPGGNTGNAETNILTLHDRDIGTNLMGSRPVLCASCHGSNALGMAGNPNLPNLSHAMHSKHAGETNDCYLCHPGQTTKCLRDVMYQKGLTCQSCHGNMSDVANPARIPWVTLPQCENCHTAQYAQNPGKRYRDSVGHGGLYCESCHGSPHAILPTIQPNDNIQNIALQGFAGTLKDCTVCHGTVPSGPGPHGLHGGGGTLSGSIFLPFINRK